MKPAKEIQNILKTAINHGMNVLVEGAHGTGKSSLILAVARELGLSLKYYSAATLDPFADLVGIPVPVSQPDGRSEISFCRPTDVNNADIVFFDELNRAHPKTLNAVFELIQFHSLNGEKLPRLRCVIGAINPPEDFVGYQVQELDPALVDRFHFHVQVDPGPNAQWFTGEFGDKLGGALYDWYRTDLDRAQQSMVSPRRLEYIGRAIRAGVEPSHAVPIRNKLPFHLLSLRLKEAEAHVSIEDIVRDPARFAREVSANLNIAIRVSQLIPMMKPGAKGAVREVLLALPNEVLAELHAKHPFVFPAAIKSVRQQQDAETALAFERKLEARLEAIRAQLQPEQSHESNKQPESQRKRAA